MIFKTKKVEQLISLLKGDSCSNCLFSVKTDSHDIVRCNTSSTRKLEGYYRQKDDICKKYHNKDENCSNCKHMNVELGHGNHPSDHGRCMKGRGFVQIIERMGCNRHEYK